jgi:hypothetical protein
MMWNLAFKVEYLSRKKWMKIDFRKKNYPIVICIEHKLLQWGPTYIIGLIFTLNFSTFTYVYIARACMYVHRFVLLFDFKSA